MRPVVHSQKHYVQITRSTVATVARNQENLVQAINVATLENHVEEGALVKAVYIELWILDSSNDGSNIVTLSKNTNNSTGPTFTQMQTLYTYPEKKNILFTHQGLSSNDAISGPIMVMRAWYKIPKSKQRFGLGDLLNLNIANNGANNLFYCGFATYKEYT